MKMNSRRKIFSRRQKEQWWLPKACLNKGLEELNMPTVRLLVLQNRCLNLKNNKKSWSDLLMHSQ
jgi:hypothetical protein